MQRSGAGRMNILAIAPYEGLKETFKKIGAAYDLSLDVELGDLCRGVELSRRALENKADIIISRGGTASYIQKELSVPVIEVEVSGYDILRILTLIKDYEGKKGLIAFSQIANGAKTICEILNIDISIYAVHSEEEVQNRLEQMKHEQYEIVVGDVIAVEKAEAIGLNGFLLTSGEESVKKAFDQALKLYKHLQETRSSLKPMEVYVEQSSEAIAFLSPTKQFLYKNKRFEKLQSEKKLTHEAVLTAINQMEKLSTTKLLFKDQENYWNVQLEKLDENTDTVIVSEGVVHHSNQKDPIRLIKPDWKLSKAMKTFISSNHDQMRGIINQAKKLHNGSRNVWISGPLGTGKESLAYYIHYGEEVNEASPLAVVQCAQLTEESLLFSEGILDSHQTILFLNIEQLPLSAQQQLLAQMKKASPNVRYIVTSVAGTKEAVNNHEFLAELTDELCDQTIEMPLLSERVEDMEQLALSFIHEWNLELGKQIVGLRSEALDLLKQQKWEGNINQLKAVIKECVQITSSPYIELTLLENVLKKDRGLPSPQSIDLSGTLEQIEDRIIFKIWNEEGRNRTKTAKRLGINRTTLWRKLNSEK